MAEHLNILVGFLFLVLGIPLGNLIRNLTKDEQKIGRKWFKLLVLIGLLGGIVGLIIGNDVVLFTFFFIAIVTSRSLVKTKA